MHSGITSIGVNTMNYLERLEQHWALMAVIQSTAITDGPDSPEYKERMKRDEETVEMFQQCRLNLTDEEMDQLGIVSYAPWRKAI